MDPAIAGLFGAGIGALASLLGALLSNWLLMSKQREQWLLDKQAEQEKWLRERLQEIYSNCIDSLARLNRRSKMTAEGEAVLSQEHQRELFDDYSAAQKWLSMLVVYHPSNTRDDIPLTNDLRGFAKAVGDFSMKEMPDLHKAKELRSLVIALAALDVRLQPPVSEKRLKQ